MYDHVCSRHGGISHVSVHEAAHAVAAVERNVRFIDIFVLHPDDWVKSHGGLALGGFRPVDIAHKWVSIDPCRALEILLAGSLAEDQVFGHYISEGYAGDLAVWRTGLGLTQELDLGRIEETLSKPLSSVVNDVRAWVRASWPTIRRVATELVHVENRSQWTVLEYRRDWILTEREVLDLVAETRS